MISVKVKCVQLFSNVEAFIWKEMSHGILLKRSQLFSIMFNRDIAASLIATDIEKSAY